MWRPAGQNHYLFLIIWNGPHLGISPSTISLSLSLSLPRSLSLPLSHCLSLLPSIHAAPLVGKKLLWLAISSQLWSPERWKIEVASHRSICSIVTFSLKKDLLWHWITLNHISVHATYICAVLLTWETTRWKALSTCYLSKYKYSTSNYCCSGKEYCHPPNIYIYSYLFIYTYLNIHPHSNCNEKNWGIFFVFFYLRYTLLIYTVNIYSFHMLLLYVAMIATYKMTDMTMIAQDQHA